MQRKESVVKTYPKYVLSRSEFKDRLGITEPGSVLSVSVSFYTDTVEVTLNPKE